jgi:excisionase family DNA binding protein
MSHEHLIRFAPGEIDDGGFIRLSRAAKKLDVSLSTIYGWIAAGKLPAYKIGTTVRLKASEFLRWVDIYARPVRKSG